MPHIKYYFFLYMYVWACVTSSTPGTYRSAVVDNIRRRIVGVMFPPSIFEDRCVDFRRSMCRLSKIDVSPFEDRCVALRRSMSRCVDLRRSMCRLSKIDVSPSEMDVLTFDDRCVDVRRSVMDVSTFEDR